MPRIPVDSSMIAGVEYDAASRSLEVEFNSGMVYQYDDVEQDVFDGLLAAESKGRYMLNCIIDSYETTRIVKKRRRR